MKGDALPDGDRIARYCSLDTLEDDARPASFRPREEDGDGLSVNWVELWGEQDLDTAIQYVQDDLRQDLRLSPNGLFAVLNVGQAKVVIEAATGRRSTITHQPTRVKSHSDACGVAPRAPRP